MTQPSCNHKLTPCTNCQTLVWRLKNKIGNTICSHKCLLQIRALDRQKRLDAKENLFKQGKMKYRCFQRVFLIKQFGYICQLCRLTTWGNHPIPIQVDHIDGNPANNDPVNLRMICHNCDALLPTFSGKNRGKGRKSRGLKAYE